MAKDVTAVKIQVEVLTDQAEKLQARIFEWNVYQEDLKKKSEWDGIVKTLSSEIEVKEDAALKIEGDKTTLSEQMNRQKSSATQAGQDVEKVHKERYVPADATWPIGLLDPSWTEDFHQAVLIYRDMHTTYLSSGEDVSNILESIRLGAPSAGDHFVGTTLEEQIEAVITTLDSIEKIEESCREIWEGCVVGLRSSFSYILKDLDALSAKMRDFNQHLAGVSISNLKRITLDIEERKEYTRKYRDMISSEGTLFSGLSESTQAIADISKMIQQNPVIRLADLFGVRFNVEFQDGSKKTFSDLSSIESNGTTIMIKALINMIFIRDMMRPAAIKSHGM